MAGREAAGRHVAGTSSATTGRRRGRAAVRVVGLAAVGLLAAGCFWPQPGQGPDRSAYNALEDRLTPETVESLHEVWRADTAGAARAPVTSNAGVHVNDGTTTYGFDANGGALWSYPLPPDIAAVAGMRQVVARGDQVLVSLGYGNFGGHWEGHWVDATTGVVEAEADAYDTLRGDAAAGITTFFGSGTPIVAHLSVYDLADPSRNWGGTVDLLDRGSVGIRPVTLGTDSVYVPVGTSSLYAYPRVGGRADCGPNGSFACPQWIATLPGGAASGAAVLSPDGSTLYVGTQGGQVHALDAATGTVQWSATVPSAAANAPALAGDWLYVPTTDGTLAALPAGGCGTATCTPSWTASTGSPMEHQPAVAGGLVFVGSSDGSVDAFPAAGCGAATCDALWSGDAGAPVTGAPAVSGGRLYVGTTDGLVAFGLAA